MKSGTLSFGIPEGEMPIQNLKIVLKDVLISKKMSSCHVESSQAVERNPMLKLIV